jgi:hypothetical protein
LDYAAQRSEGCRILRAVGAEWEMELPYAGLHQLSAELLDEREQLPAPQREALATAFGLSSGTRPDRFLLGLAVLSLLSNAAEEQPLVCVVDDVQWLDRSSAQVLAFVARRLWPSRSLSSSLSTSRLRSSSSRGSPSCGWAACPTPFPRSCSG